MLYNSFNQIYTNGCYNRLHISRSFIWVSPFHSCQPWTRCRTSCLANIASSRFVDEDELWALRGFFHVFTRQLRVNLPFHGSQPILPATKGRMKEESERWMFTLKFSLFIPLRVLLLALPHLCRVMAQLGGGVSFVFDSFHHNPTLT